MHMTFFCHMQLPGRVRSRITFVVDGKEATLKHLRIAFGQLIPCTAQKKAPGRKDPGLLHHAWNGGRSHPPGVPPSVPLDRPQFPEAGTKAVGGFPAALLIVLAGPQLAVELLDGG